MFDKGTHHPTVLVVLQALSASIGEVCFFAIFLDHVLIDSCIFLGCCGDHVAKKQCETSIITATGVSLT